MGTRTNDGFKPLSMPVDKGYQPTLPSAGTQPAPGQGRPTPPPNQNTAGKK